VTPWLKGKVSFLDHAAVQLATPYAILVVHLAGRLLMLSSGLLRRPRYYKPVASSIWMVQIEYPATLVDHDWKQYYATIILSRLAAHDQDMLELILSKQAFSMCVRCWIALSTLSVSLRGCHLRTLLSA
jgi:hypothetical protein